MLRLALNTAGAPTPTSKTAAVEPPLACSGHGRRAARFGARWVCPWYVGATRVVGWGTPPRYAQLGEVAHLLTPGCPMVERVNRRATAGSAARRGPAAQAARAVSASYVFPWLPVDAGGHGGGTHHRCQDRGQRLVRSLRSLPPHNYIALTSSVAANPFLNELCVWGLGWGLCVQSAARIFRLASVSAKGGGRQSELCPRPERLIRITLARP